MANIHWSAKNDKENKTCIETSMIMMAVVVVMKIMMIDSKYF
jgi:hypothetical protein